MTVEKTSGAGESENDENFPGGMRVLAVDDDPICLKVLDAQLRKCQYNVTTLSQARMALTMLREDRDRFDLVISNVHMPDMDGFKLLEQVGHEMDLPVIMSSVDSDTKLVMKGVTHGACDYLVKPIRIDVLRNIWQHVIRRKRLVSKNENKSVDPRPDPTCEDTQGDGELNIRKRGEEENESKVGNESQDAVTRKRARVVWSIELHMKFVAAVNHLGLQKAVPKRIMDLMNEEGLTRENVASHLQKYRLYLKRISSVAIQQDNIMAAFRANDSPFMLTRPFAGFPSLAFPHYLPGSVLDPSSFIDPSPFFPIGKMQPGPNPNPNPNQGIQLSLELDPNTQAHIKFPLHGAIGGPNPFSVGSIETSAVMQPSTLISGQPLRLISGEPYVLDTALGMALAQEDSGGSRQHPDAGPLHMDRPVQNAWGSSGPWNGGHGNEIPRGGFDARGYDALDDMMNALIEWEHNETVPNCDFGFDGTSFGP